MLFYCTKLRFLSSYRVRMGLLHCIFQRASMLRKKQGMLFKITLQFRKGRWNFGLTLNKSLIEQKLTRFVSSWKAKWRFVIHRRSPKTRTSRSSWKHAVSARLSISHLLRILRAYTLSVFFNLTTQTSPNAPRPITFKISKSSLHSRRALTRLATGLTRKEKKKK